jgi:4'-phosphopantetheinyl transferase
MNGSTHQPSAHLYYAFTEDCGHDRLAVYAAALTREERARYERFRRQEDRDELALGRALARWALSRHAGLPRSAWQFTLTSHGRPDVANRGYEHVRFNLTHSSGLVACVVGDDLEVGVDVEATDRLDDPLEIAEHYFSPGEVEALLRLPKAKQRTRFFEYWTLKESYIKARGLGLAIPLEEFSFLLDGGDPIGIAFSGAIADDPSRWHFAQPRISARHSAAVAMLGECGAPAPPLCVERVVP